LLLALVGEVGELAEIYQWAGEVKPGLEGVSEKDKQRTKEEVADVFAYLIRFCDVANIDLSEAFLEKMEKNRKKYPQELVKGSSAKYTEYKQRSEEN
jgi:dCTP diphosphatase